MKRSLARLSLLLALLCITAVSSALLQGVQSLTRAAADDLVSGTIEAAPPREAALRLETGGGDASTRDATSAVIAEHLTGLPLATTLTLSVGTVDTSAGQLLVQSDESLRRFATLVEGDWPSSDTEAVLQSRAAVAAGLGVGDVVELDGALEVRIVGLWEPEQPTAPHWFGEPGAASGHDGQTPGPLMVSAAVISAVDLPTTARWTVEADAPDVADLGAMSSALASLLTTVERAAVAESFLTVDGSLDDTVSELRETIDAATRVAAVPLALVVAASFVTLARIAALLWSVRRPETVLLRARGTSTRRLLATAALEAAPIATLGAAAGLIVPSSSFALALGTALVALAVLVGTAVRGVRGAVTTVSNVRTRAAIGSVAVLIVVAAAVSLWQFVLYTNAQGANPFGALAPALGILALAVAAVGVVSPAFRAIERVAVRAPGIGPSLAVRHLARDAAVHGTSVLLIVLSVGGLTLAAGYAGSAQAAERQSLQTANGGDVRVSLETRAGVDDDTGFVATEDYARLPGASSSLSALSTEARIGDSRLDFIATAPVRPATLPAGTSTIEVELESPGNGETLEVSAWLADPQGQAVRVGGGASTSIAVPEGSWSLLAIEVSVGGISGRTTVQVRVVAVRAGTTELLDGIRSVSLSVARPSGRAMIATDDPGPLPIQLTDAASRLLTAPPGSAITLTLPATGGTVDAVVLATVPAIDGSDGSLAAHADLAALDDYLLRSGQRVAQPNEVWIAAAIPELVAADAALLPRYPAAITTRSSHPGVAAPSSAVFALGSVGAALIALVGVAAVAGTLGRERSADGLVLRALGIGARTAARIRFAEFSLAVTAAAALGAAAGLAAVAVYAPTLARATTLSFDAGLIAVAVIVLAGCIVAGALAGRRRG